MVKTDSSLKQLFTTFIADFLVWILGIEITSATPCPIELHGTHTLEADLIFDVTAYDGRNSLVHLEFQGPTTHIPMRLRVLHYVTHMVEDDDQKPIMSIVIYIGKDAGKNDTGVHHIYDIEGNPVVSWRYRVIRLYDLDAEELLQTGRPGVLALIGQTRIRNPEQTIPQVIERINERVQDEEQRAHIFSILLALTTDEKVITMIEQLIETDEILRDSPFLRRLRSEGREEGLAEGIEKGLEQGLEKGTLATLRATIIDALQVRFQISEETQTDIARTLETIRNETQLRDLFHAAMQAESSTALSTLLHQ